MSGRICLMLGAFRPVAQKLAIFGALLAITAAFLLQSSSTQAQVCARVKIEIVQELTLERQAFDARMKITNGLDNLSITNIGIDVVFQDAAGNPVEASSNPNSTTAKFFIALDSLDGINAVDGTGTIAPKTAGEIHWLIIPAPGAAGPSADGTLYFVGAKVSYALGGDVREVEVVPDSIYVKPMPQLFLDYFLPEQVHSDNPYTLETEPPVPFTLGVRVANNGFGPARNLKINSSQPRIVENELGLLIAFEIIGSEVNGSEATPSLLVDFGTIDPGDAGLARWFMTSTLQGKFIEFTATFSHADELGGQLTSLLEEVNTHKLIHDVLVTLPGRDSIRDFLADDPDGIRVYESDNVEATVFNASSTASVSPQGGNVYRISVGASAGFAYVRVTDPINNSKVIQTVTRADGRVLDPANAWLSKVWVKDTQSYLYYLNVFDHNNTGGWHYDVTFGGANVGNLAPKLGPTPDRNVRVGETLVYTVYATDPNGTAPTLQASPLPVGATFVNHGSGSGTLTWTPVAASIGSYPVNFAAYDGALFDNATATITVVPADAQNAAPTFTSATLVANKNQQSAPVTPTVVDADEGDKHFFDVLTQPQHGEAFVSNNQLVYVPDPDYVGLDSFSFEAQDLYGEKVTGTAQVIVVDGDNLSAIEVELVESGGAITAATVHFTNDGTIANIVPVSIRLEAHGCGGVTSLGNVTQTFGPGANEVIFPINLASFNGEPIVLVGVLDASNALPETNEFDNRAARGVRVGNASALSLSIESAGAAPEAICANQVLTATGRSYFALHQTAGSCLGPFVGAAAVQYEMENMNTGVVVRSGTVHADGTGAWHVEFGMPGAVGATYELRTFATDGESLNEMTRTFTTVSCAAAIPPPMVPVPAYPGPGGDVPTVRFVDSSAKFPWTVYPGMAIPTAGPTGSGAFGHTRGTGASNLTFPNAPALGSKGGVAEAVEGEGAEQQVVSTFDASVSSADILLTPESMTVGHTVTVRGLVGVNDSYYGLPVSFSVTEPGGGTLEMAPETWFYANGPLALVATWTPRVAGAHTFSLQLGDEFSDVDDTNDGGTKQGDAEPDANLSLPTVASLTPNQALLGSSVQVEIVGSKFTTGIVFDAGDGVVISDVMVQLSGENFGEVATATFTVASDAAPGLRNLTATTEFGEVTLTGAFWVLETLCDNVVCNQPPTVCHVATGACDLSDGTCAYDFAAAGTACDDGIACTVGDQCDGAGTCGSAINVTCNDGIPCTIDTCDSQSGCLNTPTASCPEPLCLMGGDVNGSGALNVSDVMCLILLTLNPGVTPACWAGSTSMGDVNCSGSINVADVQITIYMALGSPLLPAVDRNANMCVDTCEKLDCPGTACEPSDEACLICGAQCGPCDGSCCEVQGTGGCNNTDVQECVCDTMPECCSVLTGWSAACVAHAQSVCGLSCQ